MKKIIFNLLIIIGLASCQKEQISTGADAHDVFFLKENGVSIPIQVHGNVASKKMLVIVHGGPGGSDIFYRTKHVIENVEKEFSIAYYDQRFAGATQGSAASSDVTLFKNDLKKVLQLLKSRYGNDTKMYLMGHSWGGFLTPYFLEDGNNQDMVKGWIQVDGAHNYSRNDSLTREMLLFYGKKEIQADRNTNKWQKIVDYGNAHAFNESNDVAFQFNLYAVAAEGYMQEVAPRVSILNQSIDAVKVNKFPVTAQVSNLAYSALINKISYQAYAVPISENLYKLKLPSLLLWGKYDFVCPTGLIDDIKKNISSRDVSEKVFEKSGHTPNDNEPELFWKTLVDWVKVH